jgi:hypothetical protein
MKYRTWILNQPTERGHSGVIEPQGTEVIVLGSQDGRVMVSKPNKAGGPSSSSFVCSFKNLTLKG